MKLRLLLLLFALSLSRATMAQDSVRVEAYYELFSLMQQEIGGVDIVRDLVIINDQSADQVFCVWGDSGLPDINQGRFKSNQNQVAALWELLFSCIRRCNNFLENFNTLDEATQRARADVRFLRAYFYSIALDQWGGVPIYTSSDASEYKARNTGAEVFDFIVSELKDCLPTLPDAPSARNYGKPTQGAAQLLLARLYLNAQVYTGTPRWTEAKETAARLIASGQYALCQDYARLFMGDNNLNGADCEMVWPMVVYPENENWGNTTFLVASTHSDDMPWNGMNQSWQGLVVRRSLLQKFFPNDNCPAASTEALQTAAADDRCLFYGVDRAYGSSPFTGFYDGFSCVKYSNLHSDSTYIDNTHADTDFPLLRYAEAFLILAEADARLNGGNCSAEGLQSLNALRQRAHASTFTSANLQTLADEWAREFYLEGRRRSDLVRFGFYSDSQYAWDGKGTALLDLLPIPDNEMQRNPLCEQNPGYEDYSKKPEGLAMHTPAFAASTLDLAKVQGLWFSWERPNNFEADEPANYSLEVLVMAADSSSYYSLVANVDNEEKLLWSASALYESLGYMGVADGEILTLKARVSCRGVSSDPVAFSVRRSKISPAARTWYVLGFPVGDGGWNNSVNGLGSSMVPMGIVNGTDCRFAGYFSAEGFKMVRTPGSWDEQVSSPSGSIDDCVFSGGYENLQFSTPGNYFITIYNDGFLYYQRLDDNLPVYSTIGIVGGFNDWWNDVEMTRIEGVAHSWFARLSLSNDTELKFRANNSWDINWGDQAFPYGEGLSNGWNIPVAAGDYLVFFNDITGDYLFLDAASGLLPGGSEEGELVDGWFLNTDVATIAAPDHVSFRTDGSETSVQVLDATAGQQVESVQLLLGQNRLYLDADGRINKEVLAYYINQMPERQVEIDMVADVRLTTVEAVLRGFCDKADVRVYTESATIVITMEEDVHTTLADAYYYVGSMNGWDPALHTIPLVKEGEGVYRITFTQPAGQDHWFKVVPSTTTDWGGDFVYPLTNGESLGTGTFLAQGNDGAWLVPATAEDATFTLLIDFNTMTYTLEEVELTAINPLHPDNQQPELYSLDGLRMKTLMPRRVSLLRRSDGTVRKVMTK